MRIFLSLLCALLLLSACYEELDWREWHAEDGSFILMLPAKPKSFGREISLAGSQLKFHMLSTDTDGLAFGIAYADVPANASLSLVKDARDALLRNIEGEVISEKLIEVGEARGLEFQAVGHSSETPMLMAARVLRSKERFYQIVFVGRQNRADKVDVPFFLESFKTTR